MEDGDEDLRELLATARAIYFAYQQEAITFQQAKSRTQPLLISINEAITKIAKKYRVKPQYISFSDLGQRI